MEDDKKQNLEERVVDATIKLLDFANGHSLDEVLEEALNQVEDLTGSLIGFYHFVDDDQKSLTLQNWSTRTKKVFCRAEAKGMHYEVSKAGVWADCVKERKTIVHNDYASLSNKKGMPPGHATVTRELVVPVMRDGTVKAILGTGNKSTDYNDRDIKIVSMFADLAWGITEMKRTEQKIVEKSNEQEKMNKFMVGRELKMIELKNEIEKLKAKSQDK